jgi:hypothetical protein
MKTLTFRLDLTTARSWADREVLSASNPTELLAGILDAVAAIRSRQGWHGSSDRSVPLVLLVERDPGAGDLRRWVPATRRMPWTLAGTLEEIGEDADAHAEEWFANALAVPRVIDFSADEIPF